MAAMAIVIFTGSLCQKIFDSLHHRKAGALFKSRPDLFKFEPEWLVDRLMGEAEAQDSFLVRRCGSRFYGLSPNFILMGDLFVMEVFCGISGKRINSAIWPAVPA